MRERKPVLFGVYPVLATPFREDDSVDTAALRRIVYLVIASGAHGVVYPANASEYDTLNGSERSIVIPSSSMSHPVNVFLGLGF